MKLFEIPMFMASLLGFGLLTGLEMPDAYADFALGEPVNMRTVVPAVDPAYEAIDCISSDGLEMYIESIRPGGHGNVDLWVLKRTSTEGEWGPPENLGAGVNTSSTEAGVCISADSLRLYFGSNRPGGYGGSDIYMSTRATRDAPWDQAVNMGDGMNTPDEDMSPSESPNGLELYMNSNRAGGYGSVDIYVARRAAANDPWGDPANVGPLVNSAYDDQAGLSPDGLLLLVHTSRPGGYGDVDVWISKRANLSAPWGSPVNLGPTINSSGLDGGAHISPDGQTLWWFDSNYENWQAPILPIVDFNADDKVDLDDLRLLIDHWGTADTLYDIGPYTWGDGKVDIEDLKAFITEWEKANSMNSQQEDR